MAPKIDSNTALNTFNKGEFQQCKATWLHTLVNAFDMEVKDAVTVCEHLVDAWVKERKNGKSAIRASGAKTIKGTITTKDIELSGLDGELTKALTWVSNAGKNGVSYANSSFAFVETVDLHIAEIIKP